MRIIHLVVKEPHILIRRRIRTRSNTISRLRIRVNLNTSYDQVIGTSSNTSLGIYLNRETLDAILLIHSSTLSPLSRRPIGRVTSRPQEIVSLPWYVKTVVVGRIDQIGRCDNLLLVSTIILHTLLIEATLLVPFIDTLLKRPFFVGSSFSERCSTTIRHIRECSNFNIIS